MEGTKPSHFFWRNLRKAAILAAMTANSDWAQTKSISLFAFLTASSAAGDGPGCAFSSSRSLPRTAVSERTVTRSGLNLPGQRQLFAAIPVISMRTEPGLMRVIVAGMARIDAAHQPRQAVRQTRLAERWILRH